MFRPRCVDLDAQDDFYNRYLVRHNLFEPVIQAFLANGPRYNLLNRCRTPHPDDPLPPVPDSAPSHFTPRLWLSRGRVQRGMPESA